MVGDKQGFYQFSICFKSDSLYLISKAFESRCCFIYLLISQKFEKVRIRFLKAFDEKFCSSIISMNFILLF